MGWTNFLLKRTLHEMLRAGINSVAPTSFNETRAMPTIQEMLSYPYKVMLAVSSESEQHHSEDCVLDRFLNNGTPDSVRLSCRSRWASEPASN
jgi:hypothetical protein